jgi:1,4-alpha-glucan branching enzyme
MTLNITTPSGNTVQCESGKVGDLEQTMKKQKTTKTGKVCKITFELPPEVNAKTAFLVGEFNDWDKESLPMKRHKDGSFTVEVALKKGTAYRFRYWLDGARWENDHSADAYLPNPYGSDDSVVQV